MSGSDALRLTYADLNRVVLGRELSEARREVAIGRALLAAAWEREKHQQAVISGLRAELLAAHDIAGRAEPYLYIGKGPAVVVNPFREFSQDRRRVGG